MRVSVSLGDLWLEGTVHRSFATKRHKPRRRASDASDGPKLGYSQRVQLEAGEPAGAATTRLLSCCLCDHCRSRFRWDKGLDVKDALHFLGRRFRF